MIKQLTKLANHLDSKGLRKEADYLDSIIIKAVEAGKGWPMFDVDWPEALMRAIEENPINGGNPLEQDQHIPFGDVRDVDRLPSPYDEISRPGLSDEIGVSKKVDDDSRDDDYEAWKSEQGEDLDRLRENLLEMMAEIMPDLSLADKERIIMDAASHIDSGEDSK